ncbi:hypothetical protein [Hoeflea sp.]|jgi:hypothetical protein|uniref:hypothetical protein n=1 Tax=Hoeflea sp. TaxID=1940281 RepID=UPI0019B6A714|nr:hypothetical protein [Hoeflea sp.]MBC7283583.1 hypothetical protein [Hoeflea sp.]
MKSIDLFYQGEGVGEIAHIELEPDATFATLKTRLAEKHQIPADALLFIEDEDEPIDEGVLVKERATAKGLKVHFHRCRHVEVTVMFNGETVERRFPPSATVARVKRWAAEKKFGMSEEEAGEHVLQIAGTHDRPAPGTHIGSLTDGKVCSLAFDLVPDERVNGAAGGVA